MKMQNLLDFGIIKNARETAYLRLSEINKNLNTGWITLQGQKEKHLKAHISTFYFSLNCLFIWSYGYQSKTIAQALNCYQPHDFSTNSKIVFLELAKSVNGLGTVT